jgi:hypothetical protein
LAKGALATAFAKHSDAQQQQQQQQQQSQLQGAAGAAAGAAAAAELATSPPDVGTTAPSSPQQRLLSLLHYKRSKSSPLEDDGVCHQQQGHMQLAHSAPDVTHRLVLLV